MTAEEFKKTCDSNWKNCEKCELYVGCGKYVGGTEEVAEFLTQYYRKKKLKKLLELK